MPCSEIINSNPDPELTKSAHCFERTLRVEHHGALGDVYLEKIQDVTVLAFQAIEDAEQPVIVENPR